MTAVFLDAYSVADTSLEPILALCPTLLTHPDTQPQQVVQRCLGAKIVITNKVRLGREEFEQLPDLRLICVAATGMNNIDLEAAAQHNIEVLNAPAYSTQSVAEATFALALGLMRQVPFYNDFVQSGEYAGGTRCFNLDRPIAEISGKTWGIIGMGVIGQRVAGIAQAFGAVVQYHSTTGANTAQPFACVGLSELLKTSDIVSIHCPLTPTTRDLIGHEELTKMKPTAIILNLGRGGIINETALADALNANEIAGAGLDVFEHEPINPSNPLLGIADLRKLITAPHCGWSSAEARTTLVAIIAQNIAKFLAQKNS